MNAPVDEVSLESGCDVDVATLQSILRDASAIVAEWYGVSDGTTYKADGSPLTQADTETDRFLRQRLLLLCPDAGWLSEESADDLRRLRLDPVWIVDPLDGTREFVRRIPEVAVSIGLVRQGRIVAGGVMNPLTGEGGAALLGGDCRFWGVPAHAAPAATLATATASISQREIEDGTAEPFLRLVATTRPVGSVAYKLLRVAAGLDDLTFSVQPKSEWAVCGGIALLLGAGKVYRRLNGLPSEFNQSSPRLPGGAVAGPAPLVDEFIARHASLTTPID